MKITSRWLSFGVVIGSAFMLVGCLNTGVSLRAVPPGGTGIHPRQPSGSGDPNTPPSTPTDPSTPPTPPGGPTDPGTPPTPPSGPTDPGTPSTPPSGPTDPGTPPTPPSGPTDPGTPPTPPGGPTDPGTPPTPPSGPTDPGTPPTPPSGPTDPDTPPGKCKALGDVSLVLDNSTSIDPQEFVLLRQTAHHIIDAFSLNIHDGVMLGVSRFKGSSALVSHLSDNASALHHGIDGLVQGAPDLLPFTNLVAGLNGGAEVFQNKPVERAHSKQIMIFITDGDDTVGNPDSFIHLASLNTGAEVFVVGVGDEINQSTLRAIATINDSNHIFHPADFGDLANRVQELINQMCK